MRADEWPEELPPASPPPAVVVPRSSMARTAMAHEVDPGHLFTDEEWAQVQADAEAADDAT